MNLTRLIALPVLFLFVVVGSIGGCSDNNNNLPPGACEMPRLTRDFGGEFYDFVDDDNGAMLPRPGNSGPVSGHIEESQRSQCWHWRW